MEISQQTRTWTTQGYAAARGIELIDDALCDIMQDQYEHLTPEVERSLNKVIDRLRAWREANGYTI